MFVTRQPQLPPLKSRGPHLASDDNLLKLFPRTVATVGRPARAHIYASVGLDRNPKETSL